MTDLTLVTRCGLYCGLCSQRTRVPAKARALQEQMGREGYDQWGNDFPGFQGFWAYLKDLAESGPRCSCRSGQCGPAWCGIRKCASARGVDVCPQCADYPCARILRLAKGESMLIADGQRLREIGLDAWIEEQEARARTGFAYVDIRCYPYEVPD